MKTYFKDLSDAEVLERGSELARRQIRVAKLEAQKKRDNDKINGEIKKEKREIARLAEVVANRQEEVEDTRQMSMFAGNK